MRHKCEYNNLLVKKNSSFCNVIFVFFIYLIKFTDTLFDVISYYRSHCLFFCRLLFSLCSFNYCSTTVYTVQLLTETKNRTRIINFYEAKKIYQNMTNIFVGGSKQAITFSSLAIYNVKQNYIIYSNWLFDLSHAS